MEVLSWKRIALVVACLNWIEAVGRGCAPTAKIIGVSPDVFAVGLNPVATGIKN